MKSFTLTIATRPLRACSGGQRTLDRSWVDTRVQFSGGHFPSNGMLSSEHTVDAIAFKGASSSCLFQHLQRRDLIAEESCQSHCLPIPVRGFGEMESLPAMRFWVTTLRNVVSFWTLALP